MGDTTVTPSPGTDPAPAGDPTPTTTPAATGDQTAATGKTYDEAYVAKLRQEAAKHRTDKTAVEQAAQARLDGVAVALGLKPKESDPAALTAAAQAAAEEARQARVELAVHRAAKTAGADADALLDSRAFAQSIKDVDPGDADAVAAAIAKAIKANPALKATPTDTHEPPKASGAPVGGTTKTRPGLYAAVAARGQ